MGAKDSLPDDVCSCVHNLLLSLQVTTWRADFGSGKVTEANGAYVFYIPSNESSAAAKVMRSGNAGPKIFSINPTLLSYRRVLIA